MAVVVRQGQAGSDDECMASNRVPDYLFRCSYCIKLIAEDSPVYMREDHSYCSLSCRDRGMSRLFTQLKETQLQEAWKQSSGLSIDKIRSDSSMTRTGTDSCSEGAQAGLLARFGQAVLDVVLRRIASTACGAQALRKYSSGVLWGREFLKNNSSAQSVLEYLPEVDRYLSNPSLNKGLSHSLHRMSTESLAIESY